MIVNCVKVLIWCNITEDYFQTKMFNLKIYNNCYLK